VDGSSDVGRQFPFMADQRAQFRVIPTKLLAFQFV
jgi:hypothetical protein